METVDLESAADTMIGDGIMRPPSSFPAEVAAVTENPTAPSGAKRSIFAHLFRRGQPPRDASGTNDTTSDDEDDTTTVQKKDGADDDVDGDTFPSLSEQTNPDKVYDNNKPPPTPEIMPQSPAIDFDFTPLSPMHLNTVLPNNNSRSCNNNNNKNATYGKNECYETPIKRNSDPSDTTNIKVSTTPLDKENHSEGFFDSGTTHREQKEQQQKQPSQEEPIQTNSTSTSTSVNHSILVVSKTVPLQRAQAPTSDVMEGGQNDDNIQQDGTVKEVVSVADCNMEVNINNKHNQRLFSTCSIPVVSDDAAAAAYLTDDAPPSPLQDGANTTSTNTCTADMGSLVTAKVIAVDVETTEEVETAGSTEKDQDNTLVGNDHSMTNYADIVQDEIGKEGGVGLPKEEERPTNHGEKEHDEDDNDADSKDSHDPPGVLPTPKNDSKEVVDVKEEMDHVKRAEMMRKQLDSLLDDIQATAEELQLRNPWMVTTPQVKKHTIGTISQNPSPAGSDFQNMISAATSAPTPVMGGGKDKFENEFERSETPIRLRNDDDESLPSVDSCKETPVRSNLTYAQLDATGAAEFVRNYPIQEITPRASPVPLKKSKSSVSISSSTDGERNPAALVIESNTPRTRKILEWFDPKSRANRNVSDTWPTPSMATNIRTTNTPERQLPTRSLSTNAASQQKQVSEWWIPKPLQPASNSSSPRSLPSMLGTSPTNEVSDLESPRLSYPILNYKFSEEESDIHSQSLQDQASEIHSTGDASPSLQSMLHNTYNIAGERNHEPPTPASEISASLGCPTDEQGTPISKTLGVDIESMQDIPLNRTDQTDPSPTNEAMNKSLEESPRSSWWLRRCAVFFILLAVVAAIAVPLCLRYLTRIEDGTNSIGNTIDPLPLITNAPSAVETGLSSTETPTASPVLQNIAPTTTSSSVPQEDNVGESTVEPTGSISGVVDEPSWDDFKWNRIEMGETMWRSDLNDGSPTWYFAATESGVPKQAMGVDLDILNAADGAYHAYIRRAVDDYQSSDAVVALTLSTVPYQALCEPVPGKIKICSGTFGDTDWYAQTIILMKDTAIVAAAIQINTSKELSPNLLQHVLCHQLGHSLGLPHSDEASCLKDIGGAVIDEAAISNQLQHPSQEDLDALVELYGYAEGK